MLPTLITIGPISFTSFAIGMVLFCVVFTYNMWRFLRDYATSDENIFDVVLVILFVGLVGARIIHVVTHWDIFGKYFLFPLMVWKFPGFSFWGGIFFGLIALIAFAYWRKLSVWQLLDGVGYSGWIASPIMSITIFLDATVQGSATNWFTGMVLVGNSVRQHPIGLYALLLSIPMVVVMLLVPHIKREREPGFLFLLSVFWVGLTQLLLAFMRSDLLYFRGISVVHVLSTILMIAPIPPLFKLLGGPGFVSASIKKIKAKLP